ncbi:MAG: FG-GAP-like repeat-containing protein [Chitinophagales bacterium]
MKFFTKPLICPLATALTLFINSMDAQITFSSNNSQLLGSTHSGCPVTVVDVNGDGLDDIVRLDQGHKVYVDYQRPGNLFSHDPVGDFGYSSGWAWGMCVADADHNGFKDVVAGGGGPAVKILMIDSTGLGGTIISLPNSNFFLQNLNFMDVNNDGWADIFGCDDDHESHIWVNDGAGNYSESSIIDFDITNTDDSGNYGSVWSDFDNDGDVDLYIAKCRQFVGDPSDGRRIDALFVNNGNGTFTSDAASYGLADSGQTWTCNFGDIDNDGDLDAIQLDYNVPVKLLENDGTGHMTNITDGSGFVLSIYPIESQMEDFDNDGFLDILVTGDTYELFHNNGDHTFTKLSGIFGNNNMESFATGDLNHDGKADVYASYAYAYTTPSGTDDTYWLNSTVNGNHFITFNLIGTSSTPGAYGCRVTLYGSWGKQVREVHAGESYGTCNSTNLHFGLGAAASVDSAVIHWQSGVTTTILNPAIDQFITVKEGTCTSPNFEISTNPNDPLIFCPGQSITITASNLPAGYSWQWSDGSVSQSISVTTTGNYYCTAVSASDACSVTSLPVSVIVNPSSIPTITVSGSLTLCEGEAVELTSSAGDAYSWSTGETTPSISVSQPGNYYVSVPGLCQSWSSDPVTVNVLQSAAPVTTDAYIGAPGNATVTASGNDISWFDIPMGGLPIASGNSFTTYADSTETFYAEDQQSFPADSVTGGQLHHTGSSQYSPGNNTNSYLIFSVQNNCTLKTVKVYTDIPGERIITLRDNNGTLLQSTAVYISVDSMIVTLDYNLAPGIDYQLGTDTAQNNILLGYHSPHLKRSSSEVNYPYVMDSFITVSNSEAGSSYYYYFYNWNVAGIPRVCVSERIAATIYLITGITGADQINSFSIFPNPSQGLLTIKSEAFLSSKIQMNVLDVTGKILFSKTEDGMNAGAETRLDLSGFSKGIYFLNIESGPDVLQQKVVIQ